MSKITAFEVALQELHAVAEVMRLSDEVTGFLSEPQRVLAVNIPLRMDDGSMKFFKGYRSQHNRALGPARGGTRLHQHETMDDVKALSFWMTVKNSLAGIPSGGGKGGIAVDPTALSAEELERLCRGYVRAIYPMLGPDQDVFGPDVGTPPQIMAWFMDEYETLIQRHQPGAFSGKPPMLGGSQGRDKATGYGLVYATRELLRQRGQALTGKAVAIQGFGNLGSVAAELFVRSGAKVVAVVDAYGGVYNAGGIVVAKAAAFVRETGSIKGLGGCDALAGDDLWGVSCDIMVPAALQNQITEANAGRLKASFVIEGANGPVTPAGEQVLLGNGIEVLPGIAANCGGVLVSYFEQVQNRYCYAWGEEEVFSRLEKTLVDVTSGVCRVAADKHIPLRTAAWVLALDKVIQAMKMRGWVKNTTR